MTANLPAVRRTDTGREIITVTRMRKECANCAHFRLLDPRLEQPLAGQPSGATGRCGHNARGRPMAFLPWQAPGDWCLFWDDRTPAAPTPSDVNRLPDGGRGMAEIARQRRIAILRGQPA
jgi:hypothetical protein